MEWILLALSAIGAITGSIITQYGNRKTQERQIEHDLQMADVQKKNELEVQRTMFDEQNSFNTWSNNKSQMVEAGLNPALLYGGTQPVTFGASGSASASSSSLGSGMPDFTRAFRSVDPFEVGSQDIAKRNASSNELNAETNKIVGDSQAKKNDADALLSLSRLDHSNFDLSQKKRLQNVVVDKAIADLEKTSAEIVDLKSRAHERDTLLAGRKLQLDRENEKLLNEIEREPLVRQQLKADTYHLRSLANLASEQTATEGYKRSQIVSDIRFTEERLKGSQLERIMRQTGIYQRRSPSESYRLVQKNGQYVATDFTNQEHQAFKLLVDAGYSVDDATTAVLYYSGIEPKDLLPSVINGASRILGSVTK